MSLVVIAPAAVLVLGIIMSAFAPRGNRSVILALAVVAAVLAFAYFFARSHENGQIG